MRQKPNSNKNKYQSVLIVPRVNAVKSNSIDLSSVRLCACVRIYTDARRSRVVCTLEIPPGDHIRVYCLKHIMLELRSVWLVCRFRRTAASGDGKCVWRLFVVWTKTMLNRSVKKKNKNIFLIFLKFQYRKYLMYKIIYSIDSFATRRQPCVCVCDQWLYNPSIKRFVYARCVADLYDSIAYFGVPETVSTTRIYK